MSPKVVVQKGEDPYQTTRLALQHFDFQNLKGKRVLLKPNAARLASPGEGVTTHPLVVEATIDHLKGQSVDRIAIGESCIFGVNAQKAFHTTGMKEVSEKQGVEMIDLDQGTSIEIIIPDGKIVKKIRVSKVFREFDFMISIPVMKTHMHTLVTLSIKNMKGLLWRKEKAKFHQLRHRNDIHRVYRGLDIAISDMASVIFPHFAIMDGTVGIEGMGPGYGKPKKVGLVIMGGNALSVDAIATRLMGFDPKTVPHLKLSAERGWE